jgi:hypothetical protein
LSVIEQVLAPAVADRPNWTLPRLQDEIERRTGERLSKSRLGVVLKKGVRLATTPTHPDGTVPSRVSWRAAFRPAKAQCARRHDMCNQVCGILVAGFGHVRIPPRY